MDGQCENGKTKEESDNLELAIGLPKCDHQEYKAYSWRWIILSFFVMSSASNAFHWTQLVIISNILEKYYNVSTLAVAWTSMIFMVVYIPLIFPASWLLQKKGLRLTVILGTLGTCIASWVKVAATGGNQYSLLFIGQTIAAIAQVFVLGMPAQLAATWFPSSQVSTACAVGVFGNQFGVALGFVVPAMVVRNQKDEEKLHLIGEDLFRMFLGTAVAISVLLVAIILVFKNKPESPPSRAQEVGTSEDNNDSDYKTSIKRLLTNKDYILLLISYGLNVGVFYAISSLLNSTILMHYEDAEEDAGRMGLIIVVCGMVGSMVCGFILDATHAFKLTVFLVYFLSFVGMVFYTFTIRSGSIELIYAAAAVLGFFMTGYLPLGFDFAAEVTFPESEGTSSGLLNASAQIFGTLCTIVGERILKGTDDDRFVNGMFAGVLLVGTILTGLVKPNYKRQAAALASDSPTAEVGKGEPPPL